MLLMLVAVFALCSSANAQTAPRIYRHGFETAPQLARIEADKLNEAVIFHQVVTSDHYAGEACERVLFRSPAGVHDDQRVIIPVPPSRVFNELKATIQVRSNCTSLRVGFRVCFPHQLDPRTRTPLTLELAGESYDQFSKWQQLTCQASNQLLSSQLIRVRRQLASGVTPVKLDDREAYVDQIILSVQLPQGDSALQLDDLEYGPIVDPQTLVPKTLHTQAAPPSALKVLDDRISLNGEPFFPIFTLYHGENLEAIARTGVNMLWVQDYTDRPLLEALQELKIGAIAYPPQPSPEQAILDRAGIPSLPDWTAPVWAWMLGFEIPESDRAYVTAWADQIRDADRRLRRPILADVSGAQRDFHRHVDLLASSQFNIHTAQSSQSHYEDLRRRRDLALPGKPMFAFLQTEAAGPILDYRGAMSRLPVVEPEQILHQGYAALAAGYKGVGFWKQIPFESDAVGLSERLQAIRIFSIHARILEPLLATGRVTDEIPVLVDSRQDSVAQRSPLASRWDRAVTPAGYIAAADGPAAQIRATVFHSDFGLLILLVWHEPGAQCVPGPQTAESVRVLIRGIGDVFQAWEVTPTSVSQSNLAMERISGGTELMLRKFDQAAAIVITENAEQADRLRRTARQFRQTAAESFVALAESKLQRVRHVHGELASIAPAVDFAETTLSRAGDVIVQARAELGRDHADEARQLSQQAMQLMRHVQRAYWEAAVDPLTSPTSSIDATCFQTLPDHWELMAALGETPRISENLLPSGDFESEQSLYSGWREGARESRHVSLRLNAGGPQGEHYLALMVEPDAPRGEFQSIISPAVSVKAGDIVLVTGRMHLPQPLSRPNGEFIIYDTLVGKTGGLRIRDATDGWTSFRMIRRIQEPTSLRLRFQLNASGVAELDDVQIRVARRSGTGSSNAATIE